MTEWDYLEWDEYNRRRYLVGQLRGKASDRKLRLFAIACCRRMPESLIGAVAASCLDSALKYADGLCGDADLEAARESAQKELDELTAALNAARRSGGESPTFLELSARKSAISAAVWAAENFHPASTGSPDLSDQSEDGGGDSESEFEDPDDGFNYFPDVLFCCVDAASAIILASSSPISASEEEFQQCKLIREVFGESLHPVRVDPSWRTPSVVDLAQQIYDVQGFDRMDDLAAGLEAAGCDCKLLLDHCRKVDGHVRGCWALDLLLQKV